MSMAGRVRLFYRAMRTGVKSRKELSLRVVLSTSGSISSHRTKDESMSTIRFQVLLNGRALCIAGMDQPGVVLTNVEADN